MAKIEFDPQKDADKEHIKKFVNENLVPLNSEAVLPDGTATSREDILRKLNLNPHTPPDAWLAVIGCGKNARAMMFNDAENLVNKGALDKRHLDTIRKR